jgi:hypothetical protein
MIYILTLKIIKQIVKELFSQCLPNLFQDSKPEIIHLQPLKSNIPTLNPSMDSLNSFIEGCEVATKFLKTSSNFNLSIQEDLLFVNNPNLYSNLLNNFINLHGPNSPKVQDLILEEQDLADRAYNIHTIMGSNSSPVLLNTLKNKSSLSKLLDNTIQIDPNLPNNYISSNNIQSSSSVDLSMVAVENFLIDYSSATNIALELLSN